MKQVGRQQHLRTPHFACRKVAGTSKCSRKERIQNILMDWWSRTSWWNDREKITWRKNTLGKQVRQETTQTRPRQNQKIRVTDPDSREMEIAQVGLMSYGACHTFFLAVFFAPALPSFCCTESEDSNDFEFSDSNSLCLTHSSVFLCLK